MTVRQESKFNMYNLVAGYCASNATIIITLPAFTAAVAEFDAKVLAIYNTAQIEAGVIEGHAISKAQLKKTLCETATGYAAALFAYATSIGDLVQKEKARYSFSDFNRLKDDELKIETQNLHTEIDSVVGALATYGITPATQTAFQAMIDNYESVVHSPRAAITQRATAKTQLETLFKEADDVLVEKLDKLALQLKPTQPTFYINYKNNRVIVDPGSTPTSFKGIVKQAGSDIPVVGVLVKADENTNETLSGLTGQYTLNIPVAGLYTLRFTKEGYQPLVINNAQLSLGQTTDLDAELTPL